MQPCRWESFRIMVTNLIWMFDMFQNIIVLLQSWFQWRTEHTYSMLKSCKATDFLLTSIHKRKYNKTIKTFWWNGHSQEIQRIQVRFESDFEGNDNYDWQERSVKIGRYFKWRHTGNVKWEIVHLLRARLIFKNYFPKKKTIFLIIYKMIITYWKT